METTPRPRSIVGPLLLIILGLAFLAANFGWLQWNVWELLLRLWPVWLIAIGLDIVIGGRTRIGGIAVAALVLTVMAAAFSWMQVGRWWPGASYTGSATIGEAVGQPLNGASRAVVEVRSSLGELTVRGGAAAGDLISGQVYRMDGERLQQDARNSGETLRYTLRSEGMGVPNFGNRKGGQWNLNLNETVPMDLTISSGVGEADIDLSRLQVTSLEIKTGVGEADVTLPARGKYSANINSGVGEVTVYIPKGLAAHIRVRTGIGETRVNGEFKRDDRDYISPGYDSAEHRVDLEITGGIGQVRVEQGR